MFFLVFVMVFFREKFDNNYLISSIGSDFDFIKVEVGFFNFNIIDLVLLFCDIYGFKWILVVIVILFFIFFYFFDNIVVVDIIFVVVNVFGDSFKFFWFFVGFLFGGVSVVLFFGKFYSFFDVKWLYIFFIVFFNIGFVICGVVLLMDVLIVGRVLVGMGGNGMYFGMMNLLSVIIINMERFVYFSFVGLVWGVGIVFGFVVGGVFVESLVMWRWVFYINLCIVGLFVLVYLFWIFLYKF